MSSKMPREECVPRCRACSAILNAARSFEYKGNKDVNVLLATKKSSEARGQV